MTGLAVSSVLGILVPALLGPDHYGDFQNWFNRYFILAALLDCGGLMVIGRYVPEFVERNPGAISPLVRKTLLAKLPLLALASLPALLYTDWLAYLMILGGAFSFAVLAMDRAVLYAFRQMREYSFIEPALGAVRMALILLLRPRGLMGEKFEKFE